MQDITIGRIGYESSGCVFCECNGRNDDADGSRGLVGFDKQTVERYLLHSLGIELLAYGNENARTEE